MMPLYSNRVTCFGINNEGQLVLDYYHEDTDQLGDANVYNGQNSTLWVNFRQAFADEIQETYQDLRNNGKITYDKLVDRFITNGSDKWSESIYNEDGDFKYISMLRSDNDATNLPQVRGSGEEHFRYFIENRLNYCDSKWYASDYANDYISLRIYTPTTWAGVEPNPAITVTPFSDMYAGVRYKANGTLYQERATHGVPVTFAPQGESFESENNESFNDTETAVYGAHQLSSIGDLAPLYCGSVNVSNADKLTELKVGDATEGYSNANLHELSVGTNKLLKKIDVRNCPNFASVLALSNCPSIEEVYATGTAITGVEFPEAGCLRIAHLPATIANLTIKHQLYVETLSIAGYDNIKTLWIENCPTVASLDILSKTVNVERVRLTDVDWEYDTAAEVLALATRNIGGIDENGTNIDKMWIDGKCHIKSLTGTEYGIIKETFPYLTVTYDTLAAYLIFMSEDGETELTRQLLQNGADGSDPVTAGTISRPTKESTAQYKYTFSGWSTTPGGAAEGAALKAVETDRRVYAAFTHSLRSYTVRFYNGTTLLEAYTIEYGGTATYSKGEPVAEYDYLEFAGWKPEPVNIQGDTDCYAQWYDSRIIADDWATIAASCADGSYVDKYAIGARKSVEINYEDGTSETIDFEVIAHDHDELTDDATRWVKIGTTAQQMAKYVVHNNTIYYLYNKNFGKYDMATKKCSALASPPYAMINAVTMISYNNQLHLFTAESANTNNTLHYIYDETNDAWTESVQSPMSNRSTSFVVFNDEIYMLGCSGESNKPIFKYNTTDGWVDTGLVTPSVRYIGMHPVVFNGLIHVLITAGTGGLSKHYTFDGNQWTLIGDTPIYGSGSCMVVFNNKIHLISGKHSESTSQHYVYDGNEWTLDLPIIGQTYNDQQAFVYQNKLYYVNTISKTLYSYCERGWVSLNSGTNMYAHKVHVFSDDNAYTEYNRFVRKLNIEIVHDTQNWSTLLFTKPEGYSTTIAMFNNEIHFVNSPNSNAGTGTLYKYNSISNTIDEVCSLPDNYYPYNAYLFSYKDRLYVLNGSQKRQIYVYDGTQFTQLDDMPYMYYSGYTRVIVYNNEVHILLDNTTQHYKFDGNIWTKVCDFPFKNAKGGMFVYNDELHFIGGNSGYYNSWYKFNGTEWVDTGMTTPFGNNNSTIVNYRNHLYKLGDYGAVNTDINSKAHYRLENPRAPLTFLAKEQLSAGRIFHSQQKQYWSISDLRTFCNGELYNALPEELQSAISEVIKVSDTGHTGQSLENVSDIVWIPSVEELGLESDLMVPGQGETYSVFTDNASRIRGSEKWYWTRSALILSSNAQFGIYSSSGNLDNFNMANANGRALPGFCI